MMAHYHYLLHSPPSSLSAASLTSPHRSPPVRTLLPKTLSCRLPTTSSHNPFASNSTTSWLTKIHSKPLNVALSGALSLVLLFGGARLAEAAKAGVNKPELLPKEFSTVIDVAGFLSDGQEKRLAQEIEALEKDTGIKLRVLAQNYPDTPGLAVKDFWQVDDRTIVFVADPTFGNILNFNVGAIVDLDIPRSFWSRLAGKYGNIFYWREKGEDASIESAVMAISSCLREPVGPNNCSETGWYFCEDRGIVNFLPDLLERRSTLRPADVLVFEWVGGKHACVDLTGVSPLVGLRSETFTDGGAAVKTASSKVVKHKKACLDNQHAFIPFAYDTFSFLAPKVVDLLEIVQKVMHSNIAFLRSMNVVFKRIDVAI